MSRDPDPEVALRFVVLGDLNAGGDALLDALCEDLLSLQSDAGGPMDLMLFAGDVVHAPGDEAFAAASGVLERIRQVAGCPRREVFIVPGNHDVDREVIDAQIEVTAFHDTIRKRPARMDRVLSRFGSVLARPLEPFCAFARSFGRASETPAWPAPDALWFVHRARPHEHGARILGWNTVLASDTSDAPGSLAIPGAMLTAATEGEDDEIVMVLAHHPFEWLSDGDAVRALLNGSAHVYFNAHVHDADLCPPARTPGGLLVLSVGRTAIPREPEPRFRYLVGRLELTAEGPMLRVFPRTASVATPRFEPDTRSYGRDRDGTSWLLPLRAPREGWLSRRRASIPGFRPSIPPTLTRSRISAPPDPDAEPVATTPSPPSPPPPAPPIDTLPSFALDTFVGRADVLATLAQRLAPAPTFRSVLLQAPSGEGKSLLAMAFAHQARSRGTYAGGVAWLDARSPRGLEAAWPLALAALDAPGEGSPAARVAHLAAERGPVLLVVDGVASAQLVTQLARELASARVAMLATTTGDAWIGDAGLPIVKLGPLALDEAGQLLRRTVPASSAHGKVARLLGRHALALAIAAPMLARSRQGDAFADELARVVGGAGSSTAGLIYPLFERLWSSGDAALRTAWLMASLGPIEVPTPVSWIDDATRALEPSLDAPSVLLSDAGLARIDGASEVLRIHRLAHTFARAQLDATDARRRAQIMVAFGRAAADALEPSLANRHPAPVLRAAPHFEALVSSVQADDPARASRTAGAVVLAAVRSRLGDAIDRVHPALDASFDSEALGHPLRRDAALEVAEAVVQRERAREEPDESRLGTWESRLAVLLYRSGRREAIERARQLLVGVVMRGSLDRPEDDLWLGARRAELAATLLDLGSVEALVHAREHATRALRAGETGGKDGAALASEARTLLAQIDGALRSAQAAGLRR